MLKRVLILALFLLPPIVYAEIKVAIFAGGCFWCMQDDFDKVSGVESTIAGFDGGDTKFPTYEEVSSGKTNYVESVKVIYDSNKVTYRELLDYFWVHIDPTDKEGQFCDKGRQFRSVIFYLDDYQKDLALKSLENVKLKFPDVYTEVLPSTTFYDADIRHQKYYEKNPIRYRFYRLNCNRDDRIEAVWK